MNKFIVLIIAFSSFAWVPLLHPTEYYDSDERLAPLFRLVELDRCLRESIFPVRWAPDTYGGRGSPFFNFYAPLFYYLAEIPHLFGLSALFSAKIAIGLIFIVSGVSMFLLVKNLVGERAGFLSALLYMYSPYLLFDVYIRGSLGEALSFSLFPLILLAFHLRSPLLAGTSYAALILSHNALALLFTPFLTLYVSYLCLSRELRVTDAALAFLLGLGLSAFFWVPAIGEMNGVKIDWALIYDYKGGHIGSSDIISLSGHFSKATVENKNSLQLGSLHLLLALVAYPLARTRYSLLGLTLFVLSIFMVTPYSKLLWSILPLGKYVQFPWRIFAISALFSSILGGIALNALSAKLNNRWLLALALILVLSSVNFIGYSSKIPVGDNDINVAELKEYYDSGLTYGHEYLPREAKLPTSRVIKKVDVEKGNVKIQEVKETCTSIEFKATGNGDVKVNAYWFPGWKVRVDTLPMNLRLDETGSIVISLDEGLHDVIVKFENTGIRTLSNALSLVSLLATFILSRERRKAIER